MEDTVEMLGIGGLMFYQMQKAYSFVICVVCIRNSEQSTYNYINNEARKYKLSALYKIAFT